VGPMLKSFVTPSPRIYLGILLAIVFITIALGFANYLVLLRAYELASSEEIVERQRSTGAIYGPATADNEKGFGYKTALYLTERPDIAAIGSSRAMRYRKSFFSTSFVNLGGLVNPPEASISLVRNLLQKHRPKLLILTVDFWWFTPKASIRGFDDPLRQGMKLKPADADQLATLRSSIPNLFQPLQWLAEGRLTISDLWRILINRPRDQADFPERLGVLAIKQASGFGQDGSSYHDTGIIYGWTRSTDFHFQRTRDWITNRRSGFECALAADEASFALYAELLAVMRSAGTTVVTVVPPMAGAMLDLMAKEGDCYKYVEEVRRRLPAFNSLHYDYNDMRPMGVTDCEFLDGYHPGDVANARILLDVTKQTRTLDPYLNKEALIQSIEQYGGRSFMNRGFGDRRYKEIDFLGIGGCPNKASVAVRPE
jgi:hypothetical protein